MIKDAASWRDCSCMFKVMVFTEANSRLEDGSPGSQLGGRGLSGPLAVRAWQSLPTPISCWWHDTQVPLVSLFSLHLQVYLSTLAKGRLNQDCPSLTAVIQFEGLFTGACICTVEWGRTRFSIQLQRVASQNFYEHCTFCFFGTSLDTEPDYTEGMEWILLDLGINRPQK